MNNSKGSRRFKSQILLITLIGVLLLVGSVSSSMVFLKVPTDTLAKSFENSRNVPSDYHMLELPCSVSSVNLSSNCLAKLKQIRVAFVQPIFTSSAYQSNGFYAFYGLHSKNRLATGYVTKDLSSLNVSVINSWGAGSGLLSFIQTYEGKHYFGRNTPLLTDIDINNGALFSSNGSRKFDSVVVGFSEYVTSEEYQSYKHFVETGGTLIFLNACNFLAQVQYYPSVNKLALISGHGWNFNGTMAWAGPFSRWSSNNSNWIGSDYKLFYKERYTIGGGSVANDSNAIAVAMHNAFGFSVFQHGYYGHEENVITNSSDSIIVYWDVDNWTNSSEIVATYSHSYQGGLVIHSGIFGTDLIANNLQMQFFVLVSILAQSS